MLMMGVLPVQPASAKSLTSSPSTWHITAYCGCKRCCGKSDGITASGRKATQGRTVAINWLPFGSRVKIGPKVYIVEDRGAKSLFGTKNRPIKHADIFFDSHEEARRFGSRYMNVEIL